MIDPTPSAGLPGVGPRAESKAPKCQHEWGEDLRVTDPYFGIAFGMTQTCKRCRWRLYHDYCARADGPQEIMYPPVESEVTRG